MDVLWLASNLVINPENAKYALKYVTSSIGHRNNCKDIYIWTRSTVVVHLYLSKHWSEAWCIHCLSYLSLQKMLHRKLQDMEWLFCMWWCHFACNDSIFFLVFDLCCVCKQYFSVRFLCSMCRCWMETWQTAYFLT